MVLTRLHNLYGKRTVYSCIAIIILLLAVGGYFSFFKETLTTEEPLATKKQVTVSEAGLLGSDSAALRAVGTVRAVSEARLQTEVSGRVTAVNVAIGDRVSAGTVLASIENSRERAALLQAEGAYESTLASNAQATIGLGESETTAQNTYRTAYTISDDAMRNLADELFFDNKQKNASLRISDQGESERLMTEKIALEGILEKWQTNLANTTFVVDTNVLNDAEKNVTRVSTFISDLSRLVSEHKADSVFTEDILSGYKGRFLAARSRIDGALQSISGARNGLLSAEQTATGGVVSSDSEARKKQALGSLRAAQASYEKTLVRSPISGVVNAFYLRANEYVGMSTPAAIVANNGALEVTTSVSEEERTLIAVGNPVTLHANDTEIKGTITRIAPALDPQTGKIEVKVSIDEDSTSLENGSTVSLSLLPAHVTSSASSTIRIPLQSLKITAEGPVVFTLTSDNILEAKPVVLGAITGDLVLIKSGIENTTRIVTDARGLKVGDNVEVTTN